MKVLQVALVMAMAICVAGSAVAATNAIPYMESFEVSTTYGAGFTNGETVVDNDAGWYATDTANGTVVTQAYSYPPDDLPIQAATHDNVMSFVDTVTNNVDSADNRVVYLDCMINPTRYDSGTPDLGITNEVKVALYFNTNGQVVTYGGYYTDDVYFDWITLGVTNLIDSNQWVRLTVSMQFDNLGGDQTFQYYQLAIDNTILTNALGFQDPETNPGGGAGSLCQIHQQRR